MFADGLKCFFWLVVDCCYALTFFTFWKSFPPSENTWKVAYELWENVQKAINDIYRLDRLRANIFLYILWDIVIDGRRKDWLMTDEGFMRSVQISELECYFRWKCPSKDKYQNKQLKHFENLQRTKNIHWVRLPFIVMHKWVKIPVSIF